MLLVDPTYDASIFTNNGVWGDANHSYYEMSDVSVRQTGGQYDPQAFPDTSQPVGYPRLVANSLGDLTKRENRYGHPPLIMSPAGLTTNWPHDARMWGALRLPTLRECSDPRWPLPFYAWLPANSTNFDSYGVPGESSVHTSAGVVLPRGVPVHRNKNLFDRQPVVRFPTNDNSRPRLKFDPWLEPRQWEGIDPATGGLTSGTGAPGQAQPPLIYNGSRFSDDVILTNVVSFDVKVWDPGAPIFQRPRRIGVQDGTPPDSTTIGPGDPAFVQCLRDYLSGVNNSAPISTGAFVDLGWAIDPNWTLFNANDSIEAHLLFPPHEANPPGTKPNLPDPQFHRAGNPLSALWGVPSDQSVADPDPDLRARVYDTGSSHYEKDGVAQGPILVQPRHWPAQYYDWRVNSWLNPVKPVQVPSGDERGPDAATDGLDNSNVNTQLVAVGGIDDPSEREAPPPYDAEVKAIQIKIRVFEPDSRQVREVTVVQEMISQ
ncbi:MAG: hypothetical protein SGJ19_03985 [Planctomycetia bacterium]|nr:hypothetical protein [Planctomycetia bacterium]